MNAIQRCNRKNWKTEIYYWRTKLGEKTKFWPSPYLSSSNEEHSDKDFPQQLVCLRCRRAQIGYLLVVHIVVGLLRQQIMCLSIVDETNCPGRIYERFQRLPYQMSSVWKVSTNILLYETWDSTNLISHVSDTTLNFLLKALHYFK